MVFFNQFKNKQQAREAFFKIHFSPDNEYQGNIGVFTKTKKGQMKQIRFVKADENVSASLGTLCFCRNSNYYITANSFSGYKRKKDCLFTLKNMVFDIDCHIKNTKYAREWTMSQVEYFLEAMHTLFEAYDIPLPNTAVNTGRGIQLWYRLDDISHKFIWMYEKVSSSISKKLTEMIELTPGLSGMKLDKNASGNPAGLFRMPGTKNTVIGRLGTFTVLHDAPLDLVGEYEVLPEEPKKIPFASWHGDGNALATYREKTLYSLLLLRQDEGVEETRDLFLLILYCSLRASDMPEEEVLSHVRVFNDHFTNPMPEYEWMGYLRTARRKGYRYSNSKIIDVLGITEAEQAVIGIFGNAVSVKHHRENKDSEIRRLCLEGKSKQEIARECNLSPSTVSGKLASWRMKTFQEKSSAKARRFALNGFSVGTIMHKSGCGKTKAYDLVSMAKKENARKEEMRQALFAILSKIQEERGEKNFFVFLLGWSDSDQSEQLYLLVIMALSAKSKFFNIWINSTA